jgi:hypothetical protein
MPVRATTAFIMASILSTVSVTQQGSNVSEKRSGPHAESKGLPEFQSLGKAIQGAFAHGVVETDCL